MPKKVLFCAFFVLSIPGFDAASAQTAPAVQSAANSPAEICIEKFAAKDYAAASTFCLQAANLGDAEAEVRMGYLKTGELSPLIKGDDAEMLEWTARAADHGLSAARYVLGVVYDIGTPRNLPAARYWYALAAGQGHPEAKKNLAAIDKEIASKGASATLIRTGPVTQDAPKSFKLGCDVAVEEGSFLHCHYGDVLNFVADSVDEQNTPDTVIAHVAGGESNEDGKVIKFADMTFFYRATKTDIEPGEYVNRWLQTSASQFSGFVKNWQSDKVYDGVPVTVVRYVFRDADGKNYVDQAMIAPVKGWAVLGVVRFPLTEPRDKFTEVAEVMTALEILEKTTFPEWFRRLITTPNNGSSTVSQPPESSAAGDAIPKHDDSPAAQVRASTQTAESIVPGSQLAFSGVRDENGHKGLTPLQAAVSQGDTAAVASLLSGRADVNARSEEGLSALHLAAEKGRKDLARMLVSNHADVNARDSENRTPLLAAASMGNRELVDLLLDNHADPNAEDNSGETPLIIATKRGHQEIVKTLLDRKATVDGRGDRKMTALHEAARHDQTKIAKLLLDHHADVNARDEDGATPLHYAVFMSSREMAEILLAHHADANATDLDGQTPLKVAIKEGSSVAEDLLRQHGGHE